MISSEIGSASISAAAWSSGMSAVTRAARRGGQADGDAQRAGGVDGDAVAGRDDRGRLALLDDRRTGDARARRQRIAVIDRRIDEAAVEPGRARALPRRAGRAARRPRSATAAAAVHGSARGTIPPSTPTPAIDGRIARRIGGGERRADRRHGSHRRSRHPAARTLISCIWPTRRMSAQRSTVTGVGDACRHRRARAASARARAGCASIAARRIRLRRAAPDGCAPARRTAARRGSRAPRPRPRPAGSAPRCTPRTRATSAACAGPAPPKPTMA